jgi:protein involved in polysaccharide export with SLBB domain
MKLFFAGLMCIIVTAASPVWAQSDQNSSSNMQHKEILQPISVTIGGDFIVTGSFAASRIQRIDHFITMMSIEAGQRALGSLSQLGTIKYVQEELKKYALRNITLKRSDGRAITIDLLKYRMTGDLALNPYLMDDDVILFPAYDPEKNFIDISGAVNKPLKFQYVAGDRLSDAILFAGGLNTAYENVTKAVISRLDNTGMKEELITVTIKDNAELQCGDRVRILSDENQRKSYRVRILGEVRYPGYIYVARDGSPISDVIRKAGGFTPNADLRGAEVVRDYNANELIRKDLITDDYFSKEQFLLEPEKVWLAYQEKKTLEMMRLISLDEADSLFFSIDNQLRMYKSGNLVDFTQLADSNSQEAKFLVREGDVIVVPQKFDYIYVFGGVAKAGYVRYDEGKNYRYYIEQSGGVSETARGISNAIVIKGKDMTWIVDDKKDVAIEPGDYIYVPKNAPRSTWFYVERVSTVMQILGGVATLILLLIQFTK